MIKILKKAIAVTTTAALMALSLTGCQSNTNNTKKEEKPVIYEEVVSKVDVADTKDISFWYTRPEEQEYLKSAALEFTKQYGIEVNLEQKENIDYLETINSESLLEKGPDGFMITNDQVKKAALAGIIAENTILDQSFMETNYPKTAINAITSQDAQYGYPISFDTYFLIYDTDIIEEAPTTIQEIINLKKDSKEKLKNKTLLLWDQNDCYYNYLFLGDKAQIFGEAGDDPTKLNLTDESTIKSMKFYQSLSKTLGKDFKNATYAQVKKQLKNGTLAFAIGKPDLLPLLTDTTYKTARLPNLTDELASKGLSTTRLAAVNTYSKKQAAAELFASFLSYSYADNLYSLSKDIPVRQSSQNNDIDTNIYQQYQNTKAIPKALESGDFWTYMSIAYSNIWNGSEVKEELTQVEQIINKSNK